jgi:mercuric ion transport protein
MQIISRIVDKIGSVGALVSAMGCAACFPALASLGASIGLGFLSTYEGIFINKLIPLFAFIVLISNLFAWLSHRNYTRLIWGLLGPLMVLATLYLFWTDNWSTYMFYSGIVLMIAVSIWDIVSPPANTCALSEAETSR